MGVSGRDMIKMTRYYSEAGRRNRRVDKISMNLGRIGCHQRQAKEPTWHSRGRDLGTSSGAAARTPAEPKRKARARQKGKKRVEATAQGHCPEGHRAPLRGSGAPRVSRPFLILFGGKSEHLSSLLQKGVTFHPFFYSQEHVTRSATGGAVKDGAPLLALLTRLIGCCNDIRPTVISTERIDSNAVPPSQRMHQQQPSNATASNGRQTASNGREPSRSCAFLCVIFFIQT